MNSLRCWRRINGKRGCFPRFSLVNTIRSKKTKNHDWISYNKNEVIPLKIIRQIAVILFFYVLGEIVSKLLIIILPSIFIPGSILGMILLVIGIVTKIVKKEWIEDVAVFLTSNMAFFFIPAAVGIIEYADVLKDSAWRILAFILTSTILSFFVIYFSIKSILWLQGRRRTHE